uniref:TGF-beta propeptide domain-containing protein n=1 Tax=Glossina morsitans morsitans TaxID=37546 RepID=A0A1B0GCD7_GLOMM
MSKMYRFMIFNLMAFAMFNSLNGKRVKRHNLPFGDAPIHTEYVDASNLAQVRKMFNLTEDQMKRISTGLSAAKQNAENNNNSTQYFRNAKEYRLNNIINSVMNAFHGGGGLSGSSDESPEYPLHEMAAYPKCNAETSESSWLQDNNVTIQFSHSLFEARRSNLNLDSAILRLYKINPNASEEAEMTDTDAVETSGKSKRCADPLLDSQIRITVSIVQQLRRNKRGAVERKKRICNTIMLNASKTGWVEIDIKRAIYIWENVSKQQLQNHPQSRLPVLVGWLMIEVHDEEEQPLKPGLFFKPPNCNQADLAIPWDYYRPGTSMPSLATLEVPRYPRIDVKLIGYASFAPMPNDSNKEKEKIYANFISKLYNIPEKASEINENESTTYLAPTADNHLHEATDGEMQPHYQYRRHLKFFEEPMQQHHHHHPYNSQEQQQEINEEKQNHHYHHHHHHHEQQQQQHHHRLSKQNHDESIILKHVEQKLQHEYQLHLKHQQEQQQHMLPALVV